jgi:outer membrane protein assembly factor BamE
MRRSRLLLIAASSALITACTYKPGFINEYKIDIQQGNVLTQEMVSQLKPGQTRDQVRFLLGTPLVADVFHQQRWDYVYSYRNGQTGKVESRKFTTFFDNEGCLERVGGDVVVGEAAELTAPVNKNRLVDLGSLSPEAASQPLPPREEPGYFRRFMDMLGF